MLRLSHLLDAGHVALNVSAADMPDLLKQLVGLLVEHHRLSAQSGNTLADALLRRELLGSTTHKGFEGGFW